MLAEVAEAELWSEAEQRSWSSRSNCGTECNGKPGSGVAERSEAAELEGLECNGV